METKRKTVSEWVQECHGLAKEKGWWPEDPRETNFPEKLALIHSEVSEALEEYREGRFRPDSAADGKPIGMPSELADVVIRVFDLCGAHGVDLETEIERKHAYNKTRAHRHGGKLC